uniref:LNS2/PITP domain-containing protein n=1 Tax=Catharus ustulatus TaxID=91951 RepID=A0A8C3UMT5_CATUS
PAKSGKITQKHLCAPLHSVFKDHASAGSIKRSPYLGPSAIYLEDFSEPDKKPVALYFPERYELPQLIKAEFEACDRPQQPSVHPAALPSPASSPMDSDSMPTVALSLCGGLREKFMEHMVSYQQFAENPRLISDPNLVIMINKKYYNWAVAGPIVLALQAFQRNIPEVSATTHLLAVILSRRVESFVKTLADPFPFLLTVKAPAQKLLLNLQDGPNEVAFSVTTQYQGTCRCEATIYVWNWNEKVVISDIDGTITKSDALGQILPQLGKDWTHRGIVKLFHKIHLNGYKFLYCSARAIGMAHITKGYLQWVNEQGCGLPMGPMLLSPSSLMSAFHREVIEKKPEVFKVTCLTDIRKLFATKCPFYAGFGNRPSDVYAYKQVGLPESRIFTVNPKGELIQELRKNQKSSSLLWDRRGALGRYSPFAYWRPPVPQTDLDGLS